MSKHNQEWVDNYIGIVIEQRHNENITDYADILIDKLDKAEEKERLLRQGMNFMTIVAVALVIAFTIYTIYHH